MEDTRKTIPLEKLKLDRDTAAELAGVHGKWLRFLILAEVGVVALNSALLLAGTLIYGKKTLEILRKKVEEQL